MTSLIRAGLFGATLLTLAACASKDKDRFAGVDSDYVLGTPLPERNEGVSFFGSNVSRSEFPPIYFAFDSYTISPSEMTKVQQIASSLRERNNDVIIAGFTDNRGTEEYNRGLGERRAQAVRSALINYGVNADRLQTVSFGEEMPADPRDNEEAWAKNRRAEFGVVR
ncbi:MAG: OmpA family protein [Chthoniobacterales bacterium]|nr:OmpA family protein [Chthoniobacterales bacterium]